MMHLEALEIVFYNVRGGMSAEQFAHEEVLAMRLLCSGGDFDYVNIGGMYLPA